VFTVEDRKGILHTVSKSHHVRLGLIAQDTVEFVTIILIIRSQL